MTALSRIAGPVALLALTLCACSSAGAGGTEPELGSVPTPGHLDPAQITTPLDAYLPTPEENYALKKARVLLVNACMRRLGYGQNPQPLGRFTGKAYLEHNEFLVVPLAQAEQYGYKQPPEPKSTGSATDSQYSKNTTETQASLLTGKVATFGGHKVPEGGCEGEALRTVTAGAETAQEVKLPDGSAAGARKGGFSEGYAEMVVSSARGKAMAKTRDDSRFAAAAERWSDCMKKQGYDYDSPSGAWNDKAWSDAARAGEKELAVAVADMGCKKKANYLGVGIAVETVYEKQVIEESAEVLKDAKDKTARWIENANKAIEAR
ncbi:hypothetical protein [Streptomyces sp. BE133]|uniref:hypothetical protein n=1 Tax=Streptomyces sp. BE133 TaxID=3002523 RepID=UPI002E7A12FC|nr:hypothetical protein [Streptomyces sp. BE133]MEE1812197.1 hypothetical protein [Streptomyces sp. BE133]